MWEVGFGILVLVGLGMGLWWLYQSAPWALALLVALPFLALIAWDIRRHKDYVTGDKEQSLHLSLLNPLRARFARPPIWLVPSERIESDEYETLVGANRLVAEVQDALEHSPLPPHKRASFDQQARDVPRNVVQALWKLSRLRRMTESIGSQYGAQSREEIREMDERIRAELDRSLEVFASIPVSLMKVELAHGNIATDRLLADLSEANQRLYDLSSSYAEIRELRQS